MFVITSMPVGGAEMLLVNLVRRLDPKRIQPSICCLKEKDELGRQVASDVPVFDHLIHHKFDLGVIARLSKLYRSQGIDAIVTVGAGDKMFWGRLAAKHASVPVVLSALHSTGWPDGVGRLNRLLTGITSGFIAVAISHGKYLIEVEKFPAKKVFVIPNGIDTQRFQFNLGRRLALRQAFSIAEDAPVVGIVAALRAEKNHRLFLQTAAEVLRHMPHARFVIAGDGPERSRIETMAAELGIGSNFHLLGTTGDIPGVLSMVDLFALTSHNEASPVSILEAMSCQRPVVSTDVGSINESVVDGVTGYLVPSGDKEAMARRWIELLSNRELASKLGTRARQRVMASGSLEAMTSGYCQLIEKLYGKQPLADWPAVAGCGYTDHRESSTPTPVSLG
jgi:glycosyltransferase involved in cell wall biosynthesis